MSEKRIIKLSRLTDDQLMKLANSLGVKVDQIDFKQHLNRNADYAIFNMGNPQIGGMHWPRVIPKDYSYREVEIQSPRFGHCGQYCVLWLYYLQHNQLDKFFKLFNDQSP
ncbi:hypothetical protein Plhal703r1_c42g0141891 [Plasmopara halstedii]